jgi:hypothetical protein
VTGTLVNFDGMTGRALAVILKLIFLKIVRSQKKLYLNEVVRILTGHPVYVDMYLGAIIYNFSFIPALENLADFEN